MSDDFNNAATQEPLPGNLPGNLAGNLVRAAELNNAEGVKEWHKRGANVNEKNRFGETALMIAVRNKDTQLAFWLIGNGAIVEGTDNQRTSLLMRAAQTDSVDVARLLIDKGAALNDKDELGKTALVWAVGCGQKNVLRLLLDRGASLDNATAALEYAPAADKQELTTMLDEAAGVRAEAASNQAATVEQARKTTVRERQLRLNGLAPPVKINYLRDHP